ncbi:MAG: hypothetical protein GF311_00715 [Candidatus Lokiarchaeota archaeon]|nr:hypothetical protein [Candidatus Lokiarchaeota archaeon]
MLSIFSKINAFLKNFKNSLSEILFGFILFFLAISGLAIALLLRSSGFDGGTIVFFSVITEILGLVVCYFLFNKKYLTEEPQREKRDKYKK